MKNLKKLNLFAFLLVLLSVSIFAQTDVPLKTFAVTYPIH